MDAPKSSSSSYFRGVTHPRSTLPLLQQIPPPVPISTFSRAPLKPILFLTIHQSKFSTFLHWKQRSFFRWPRLMYDGAPLQNRVSFLLDAEHCLLTPLWECDLFLLPFWTRYTGVQLSSVPSRPSPCGQCCSKELSEGSVVLAASDHWGLAQQVTQNKSPTMFFFRLVWTNLGLL